jgi:glycosyltransferase involved in cell wall biosynthesis
MVWCVAREHQEALEAYNPNTHFIPHAVDEAWFSELQTRTPPEYDGAIPTRRLVYTGVFQDKMDLALLVEIAERRPEWQQVFVGPVELDRLDRSLLERLEGLDNVHFLGERDVDELPGFMAGATVLMLPYRPTPYSQSAGLSLKFFEYLISGKPILVAPFTRMQVSDRLYYLADGADEWIAQMDSLADGDGEARQKERIAAAMENTYEARIQEQKRLLEPFLK